jgi:hypothetical protein
MPLKSCTVAAEASKSQDPRAIWHLISHLMYDVKKATPMPATKNSGRIGWLLSHQTEKPDAATTPKV